MIPGQRSRSYEITVWRDYHVCFFTGSDNDVIARERINSHVGGAEILPLVLPSDFVDRNRHRGRRRSIAKRQRQRINAQLFYLALRLVQNSLAGHQQPGAIGLVRQALEFTLPSELGVIDGEGNLRPVGSFPELEKLATALEQINVLASDGDRLEIAILLPGQCETL